MNSRRDLPNIIYILADDLGYGDLSCLNPDSKLHTVHLDAMAEEGISFTDAHASSAVCTPSRYSILTGRYNWRSRLKSSVLGGYHGALIEQGRMTVAGMLQTSGYKTACIGKWHLGMDWKRDESRAIAPEFAMTEGIDYAADIENAPVDFGFDYFYGISGSLDMPPYVYIENRRATAVPDHITESGGQQFWRKGPTAPDFKHEEVLPKLTERVLDTIEKWKDDPFFIYFPLPAPHTPILPVGEFEGKSKTNAYGDFVLMCDDVVGQVISKLEEQNLTENTIVIFTSDNGCSPMADYEELEKFGHNPSYIFRGTKSDIYEGGHRIPLIVKWPAAIGAGRTCDDTVCLVDFMATAADIIKFQLPDCAAEDSVSNLPIWRDEKYQRPLREATVHHSFDGCFSIRKGEWKLEMCPGSGGWSYPTQEEITDDMPKIQLYHLGSDVSEKMNVSVAYPEICEELKQLLIKYISEGRSTPGDPQKNTGAAYWDELHWMREEQ